ncbi:MAG TPA: hypothetical protein VF736_23165 [Pyrinomonadaceae bacterium]
MFVRTLLAFALLLCPASLRAGQSPAPQRPVEKPAPASQQDAAESEPDAREPRRQALLADLRSLEAESKELLKPLDAASARAEIAAAAWSLERGWAKSLLREALPLTFPEEVDRARLRRRAVGGRLDPPTPEDSARSLVRDRVLKVAAAEPAFARELSLVTAREMGPVQEVAQYTRLAGAALKEGKVEEASDLVRHAIEAEPSLIDISFAVNDIAVRDRAAGDRLALRYIEVLRGLPLSAYAEQGGAGMRVAFGFMSILRPASSPFRSAAAPPAPAGREVVRAYIAFVLDTVSRLEQSGADLAPSRFLLASAWPLITEVAPEYAAQFNALERAGRRPGQSAPPLSLLTGGKEDEERRYEERLKSARQSKDPEALEVAASVAMTRKDFEEARKLVSLLKEGEQKSRLSELVNVRESQHLAEKGDLVGAERLARQLEGVSSILLAYPTLVRALAREGDAGRAALLVDEAVRRLRAAAERGAGDADFVPTALAPFAGSLRPFKQTRALVAMSELALAVEPVDARAALDALDALAETASKARVTSEQGNPNFNAEAFARVSAADAGRARSAAARFEDRLQRIVALAAVCRGEAERLEKTAPR